MKYLKFTIFLITLFISLVFKEADAAFLIQRPLYLGLGSGLVGNWTFDGPDMAGVTAYDRSGQSPANNGTLTGGPARALGKVGQALSFDGSNDYVDISPIVQVSNLVAFSFSAWFKTSTTERSFIFAEFKSDAGRGFYCDVNENVVGDLECGVQDSTESSAWHGKSTGAKALNNGNWHHVVAIQRSKSNFELFVDNVSYGISTATIGAVTVNKDEIGANSYQSGNEYAGLIDEVRIYNRALSASEIKRLYKIGATMKINKPTYSGSLTSGLVGNWTFDGPDMAGVTAYDRSGQSPANNGALTGGPARALGAVGQALSFDGEDDYINTGTGDSLGLTGAMTVSAWTYIDQFGVTGTAVNSRLVSKKGGGGNRGWDLTIENSDDKVYFGVSSDGTNMADVGTTGVAQTKVWTHYVGVFEPSTAIRIYVNGVLNNSNTTSIPASQFNNSLTAPFIGARNDCSDCYFDGLIDEVRVYNRALSATEIKRLYEAGR